jgi:hypothetical protein
MEFSLFIKKVFTGTTILSILKYREEFAGYSFGHGDNFPPAFTER